MFILQIALTIILLGMGGILLLNWWTFPRLTPDRKAGAEEAIASHSAFRIPRLQSRSLSLPAMKLR